MRAVIVAGLLVCILLPPAQAAGLQRARPESVGLSSERLERLDRTIRAYVDEGRLGGAVVLVARRGRVAWLRALGYQDVAAGVPMATDSLFQIWSMTKPITSVALLMLLEEGHYQLTDPAERHIPAFAGLKVLDHVDDAGRPVLVDQKRPMTVQDLFRHTSGLGYGFTDNFVDKAYRDAGIDVFEPLALEDLVQRLATAPLNLQPGSQWQYSFAHDVQAYLVERFSGMRFDRFLKERLFDPLGMKNTSFGVPNGAVERLVTTYGPRGREEEFFIDGPLPAGIVAREDPKTSPYLDVAKAPAGGHGLVSTAEDYFRFAQMLLNGGTFNGRRILSRKTVELMTTNHLSPGMTLLTPGTGYGLGVSVLTDIAAYGNLGSEGQFGWGGAASTWFFIDPREELVAVLMVQYRPVALELVREFQTLVYQAIAD